ncbi:MAG TPA: AbrB/MazE/SpoVT family DNA-binding domain-containing protein [Firmicutes bacterium]|jgi:antitoxin MazE|nr:AbrB/MazE/SpoVT family DNA-binding domain-containing protein [Bacillota bacterium]
MEVDIIRIGNFQGIRLPLAILRQCGIGSRVELEIKDNCIIIKPLKTPRQGWAEALELMHKERDDLRLVPEEIGNELLEDWDD